MKHLLVLTTISLLIACSDDADNRGSGIEDCDTLTTALIELDGDQLDEILTPELEQLTLLDQDNDACPHNNNLEAFQELLADGCEEITEIGNCCGCSFSDPPISQVELVVDSQGVEVTRFIDLETPLNGQVMHFVRVRGE